MDGIIQLSDAQRKVVLKVYRGSGDARTSRRGHVLLLLAEGRSWREIIGITFCRSSLIRNHRCRDMSQVLGDDYDFLESNNHPFFELHRVFDQAA